MKSARDLLRCCKQVCIPVDIPGRPPASVAVVGMQRSDMRLLTAAEKLGPHIQEAAAKLAVRQNAQAPMQNGKPADASASPKPLANGAAKKAAGGDH